MAAFGVQQRKGIRGGRAACLPCRAILLPMAASSAHPACSSSLGGFWSGGLIWGAVMRVEWERGWAGSEPRVACNRVQLHPPQALAIATITVHSLFEQRALYFIKAIAYLCSYLTYSKVYVISHFIDEKKEVRRRLHSSRGTNRIQVPPLPCVLNMQVTISGPRKPQTTSVKGL